MSKQKPALQTVDLIIGYRTRRNADNVIAANLSLTLKRGELVGLLGPNGAGKSTLLRTVAGMQKPLSGQVLISGDNIRNLPSKQRAHHLSVVLTDRPNVGLMNGYALVALGRHPYTDWTGRLSSYDEAMIRWAVDAVNAKDIADSPIIELSDGQRQKLMIARALAQETDVILLDEPTAFLDLPHRVETMQLLKQLAHQTNRAILLSTHDLDLALRNCDKLWLMSRGNLHIGTPEDLVLTDAFEATFHSDGVTFNKQTGAFSIERPDKPSIHVNGHGISYIWTCRALERIGYTIVEQPTNPNITILDDHHWQLNNSTESSTYSSIEQLLNALAKRTTHEQYTIQQ